jgi:hypothetical protein
VFGALVQTEQSKRVGPTDHKIDRRVALERVHQEHQKTLQECDRTKDMRWARHRDMLLTTLRCLGLTGSAAGAIYELETKWAAIGHLIACVARHIS